MAYDSEETAGSADVLTLTAEIVASYVGNAAHVQASEIPAIIKAVRSALEEAASPAPEAAPTEPQADKPSKREITKSITPDALISFLDGKPYKTLKRHLTGRGMDMKAYRERYGLPNDYPSVAPNYSAARSEMARKLGLGARGRSASTEAAPAKQPAARGRKKADAAA